MDVKTLLENAWRSRLDRNFGDAIESARAAANFCRDANDDEGLTRALTILAQVERDNARLEHALDHYTSAARSAKRCKDRTIYAHVIRHQAEVLTELGRIEEAGRILDDAVAIYRAATEETSINMANALRAKAVLNDSIGAVEDAHAQWKEARQIYLRLGIADGVAECDQRINQYRS